MGVHTGLSTSDSSVTYLSSFGKGWSPRSRSRNRYRGGKGSTSVSRSFIVETGGRSTSPRPTFPAQGRLLHTAAPPHRPRPRWTPRRPPASSFWTSATPPGAGQAPAGGGAEGGARQGRGAFRVLWALYEALFLPPQDVWRWEWSWLTLEQPLRRSLVFFGLAWEPSSSLDLGQASFPASTVQLQDHLLSFLQVLEPGVSTLKASSQPLSLLSGKRQFETL